MQFRKTITLKDGRTCVLRSGTEEDGKAALEAFILTHAQTDWLLSYPDEIRFTVEQEAAFLRGKAESADEIEILAQVGEQIVGMAGFESVGKAKKLKHRASFGVSIDRAYWGLGIGRALTEACIACAAAAGYRQLELEVVEGNKRAVALYESLGFAVFGRNPLGFCSGHGEYKPLLLMRLELDGVSGNSA